MLIFLLCLGFASILPAQVAEICDNRIDDDGDGLIDCEDDDCPFPLFSNYAYGTSNSWGVALGDLDGDGDLDAWVANRSIQANHIFVGIAPCSDDYDADGIPNDCDIDQILGPDCDGNSEDDTCQIDTDKQTAASLSSQILHESNT
jgi:hypothetical protein